VLPGAREGNVDSVGLGDQHERLADQVPGGFFVATEAAQRAAVLQLVAVRGGIRGAPPAVQDVNDLVLSPMFQQSVRLEALTVHRRQLLE
jgi:hypothetical protein